MFAGHQPAFYNDLVKRRTPIAKAGRLPAQNATEGDNLITDVALSEQEVTACMQKVREQAETVESLLMVDRQTQPIQIGLSLVKFFNVPHKTFNPWRTPSEMLHGLIKGEFIELQRWIPLEETSESLVILCMNPEAVRGLRVVLRVFPLKSKFAYCVTT